MKELKVIMLDSDYLEFDNGIKLYSHHEKNCCENHYLSMRDLTLEDFDGLLFDLSNDNFFRRIPGYGIELVPVNGWSVKIPGYGYNNGYYSSSLELIISDEKEFGRRYAISACQKSLNGVRSIWLKLSKRKKYRMSMS